MNEEQLVSRVVDDLIKTGYPPEIIAREWGSRNYRMDIAVLDKATQIPLMIIECKREGNTRGKASALTQLRRYYESLNYPVRAFAVFVSAKGEIEYYDYTEIVKDKSSSTAIANIKTTCIPSYSDLTAGAKGKLLHEQNQKRKQYINGLRIICWVIGPIIAILLGILDALNVYMLSTERLVLLGLIIILLLIPFFGEIQLGDITFRKKENSEKADNVHKDEV